MAFALAAARRALKYFTHEGDNSVRWERKHFLASLPFRSGQKLARSGPQAFFILGTAGTAGGAPGGDAAAGGGGGGLSWALAVGIDAVSIPAIATATKASLVEEYVICLLLSTICSLSRVSEESPGDVVKWHTPTHVWNGVNRHVSGALARTSALPPITANRGTAFFGYGRRRAGRLASDVTHTCHFSERARLHVIRLISSLRKMTSFLPIIDGVSQV
jgi:hypothetical protein